jgi:hypothetical protein
MVGHTMQWLTELTEKERLLKKDFENLSGIGQRHDLVTHDARVFVVRRIKSRLGEIRSTIDLHVGGNPEDRIAINNQVDLELPMYSHLRKMLALLS